MNKKQWILLGGGCGCFGLLVVTAVVVGLVWFAKGEEVPLLEGDRDLVVTASDLVPYFEDYEPDESLATLVRTRYLDDTESLDYEYDSPADSDPYVAASISWEGTAADAHALFLVEWTALRLGMNVVDTDVDLVEDNAVYAAGDESRFGNIVLDGETLGHAFIVRQGRALYVFILSSFWIEDPEFWHELFDERIARLKDE